MSVSKAIQSPYVVTNPTSTSTPLSGGKVLHPFSFRLPLSGGIISISRPISPVSVPQVFHYSKVFALL